MQSVGLRDLKNRLSEYVRKARSGEAVLVTDRGEIVAELVPPGPNGNEPGIPSSLVAVAKQGHVTLGAANSEASYPKLPPALKRTRSAELLDQERGAR